MAMNRLKARSDSTDRPIRECCEIAIDELALALAPREGGYLAALDKVVRSEVGRRLYALGYDVDFASLSVTECLELAETRELWEVIATVRRHLCVSADLKEGSE